MRIGVALSAAIASGCAGSSLPSYGEASESDCGVVAAVLVQRYGFDETPRREPYVSLNDSLPRDCAWSSYQMAPPRLYEPREFAWAPRHALHISRPRYFSGGATVEVSERRGSEASTRRYQLTHSGVMGWIVLPQEWEGSASAAGPRTEPSLETQE